MEMRVEEYKVSVSQDMDTCCPIDEKDQYQYLSLEVVDNGHGYYFVMKTDRWAFEDVKELTHILNVFISRAEEAVIV